jgi:hypothetical protein
VEICWNSFTFRCRTGTALLFAVAQEQLYFPVSHRNSFTFSCRTGTALLFAAAQEQLCFDQICAHQFRRAVTREQGHVSLMLPSVDEHLP